MTPRKDKNYVYLRRNYLIQHRAEKGMSQYAVALACDMELPTYNQIENGRLGRLMNAKKLIALSNGLGIPLETICHEEALYLDKVDKVNHTERR